MLTKDIEVRSIPMLSFAHIPGEGLAEIRKNMSPSLFLEDTYGLLLFVGETPDAGAIEWLKPIFVWAAAHNFAWVWFDCDAPSVTDLPVLSKW